MCPVGRFTPGETKRPRILPEPCEGPKGVESGARGDGSPLEVAEPKGVDVVFVTVAL